jgi:hypothetical protein
MDDTPIIRLPIFTTRLFMRQSLKKPAKNAPGSQTINK